MINITALRTESSDGEERFIEVGWTDIESGESGVSAIADVVAWARAGGKMYIRVGERSIPVEVRGEGPLASLQATAVQSCTDALALVQRI